MLAVTGVLALEFGVTLPLLSRGPLHGDARTYGTISATMALGAVVGGLFTASRRGRRRATALSVSAVGWASRSSPPPPPPACRWSASLWCSSATG
jgi:hypothetical protein